MLGKIISGNPYHEGAAVTVQPVILNPSTHIHSVRAGQDFPVDKFNAATTGNWMEVGYYYNEQP